MSSFLIQILISITITSLFFSCLDETSIEIPAPELDRQLAVMAYLIDSTRAEVIVSKVLSPSGGGTIDFSVQDASVRLFKNGEMAAELSYDPQIRPPHCPIDSLFSGSKYLSDEIIIVEYGATYFVEVSVPGFPNVRSEEVSAVNKLKNFEFRAALKDTIFESGENRIRLDTINVKYDYSGNFDDDIRIVRLFDKFRCEMPLEDRSSFQFDDVFYTAFIVLSPENSTQQILISPEAPNTGWRYEFGNTTYYVDVLRFPEAFIDFRNAIRQQDVEALSGIYSTSPAPIPTNMIGGYGYFVIPERHYGTLVRVNN